MRTPSRLLPTVALLSLVVSCDQASVAPDDDAPFVPATSSNPQARWISDYMTPLVPQYYGLKTLRCTYPGPLGDSCVLGDELTIELLEEETVPYQTGALTGRWLRVADSESAVAEFLVAAEDKIAYMYGERTPFGGTYYAASAECELTAPPPQVVWGSFVDGTIIDNSGTVCGVNKDDPEDCVCRVSPAPDGGVDSNVGLMQIQDVQISGKKYNNALLWWELEPFLPFQPLQFDGKELEFGITLPTEADTGGAAVDGVVIYGFHKGIVALMDASNDSGRLGDVWELVSVVRP